MRTVKRRQSIDFLTQVFTLTFYRFFIRMDVSKAVIMPYEYRNLKRHILIRRLKVQAHFIQTI